MKYESRTAYLLVEVHHDLEADDIYLDDLSVTEAYWSHGICIALIRLTSIGYPIVRVILC